MAIKVTATKGGFALINAYLIIAECMMQKSVHREPSAMKKDEDENYQPHTTYIPTTTYRAVAHVYSEEKERIEQYGTPLVTFSATFDHVTGIDAGDIVQEAYAHIKATGIPGWTVNSMVDA